MLSLYININVNACGCVLQNFYTEATSNELYYLVKVTLLRIEDPKPLTFCFSSCESLDSYYTRVMPSSKRKSTQI